MQFDRNQNVLVNIQFRRSNLSMFFFKKKKCMNKFVSIEFLVNMAGDLPHFLFLNFFNWIIGAQCTREGQ